MDGRVKTFDIKFFAQLYLSKAKFFGLDRRGRTACTALTITFRRFPSRKIEAFLYFLSSFLLPLHHPSLLLFPFPFLLPPFLKPAFSRSPCRGATWMGLTWRPTSTYPTKPKLPVLWRIGTQRGFRHGATLGFRSGPIAVIRPKNDYSKTTNKWCGTPRKNVPWQDSSVVTIPRNIGQGGSVSRCLPRLTTVIIWATRVVDVLRWTEHIGYPREHRGSLLKSSDHSPKLSWTRIRTLPRSTRCFCSYSYSL